MGLVHNLKKIWKIMEQGYSDGLSSPSTKQKEKPISKKPDNSLSTESSQKALTTENQHSTIRMYCPDISGKIIMEKTTEDIVAHVREWAINRVGDLHEEVYKNQKDIANLDDACAIYQEFVEWIEPETKEIDILSLEKET